MVRGPRQSKVIHRLTDDRLGMMAEDSLGSGAEAGDPRGRFVGVNRDEGDVVGRLEDRPEMALPLPDIGLGPASLGDLSLETIQARVQPSGHPGEGFGQLIDLADPARWPGSRHSPRASARVEAFSRWTGRVTHPAVTIPTRSATSIAAATSAIVVRRPAWMSAMKSASGMTTTTRQSMP